MDPIKSLKKKISSEVKKFNNIKVILQRLDNQGFLQKLQDVILEIKNSEDNFTFVELKKLQASTQSQQKNVKFDISEQFQKNLSIFEINFQAIIGIIVEQIWTEKLIPDYVGKINSSDQKKPAFQEFNSPAQTIKIPQPPQSSVVKEFISPQQNTAFSTTTGNININYNNPFQSYQGSRRNSLSQQNNETFQQMLQNQPIESTQVQNKAPNSNSHRRVNTFDYQVTNYPSFGDKDNQYLQTEMDQKKKTYYTYETEQDQEINLINSSNAFQILNRRSPSQPQIIQDRDAEQSADFKIQKDKNLNQLSRNQVGNEVKEKKSEKKSINNNQQIPLNTTNTKLKNSSTFNQNKLGSSSNLVNSQNSNLNSGSYSSLVNTNIKTLQQFDFLSNALISGNKKGGSSSNINYSLKPGSATNRNQPKDIGQQQFQMGIQKVQSNIKEDSGLKIKR